jgi:hypothetical protein
MQQFLQFIILTFIYSSTGYESLHAHHQELNNCSSSLWFLPSERGDSSAVGYGDLVGDLFEMLRIGARCTSTKVWKRK